MVILYHHFLHGIAFPIHFWLWPTLAASSGECFNLRSQFIQTERFDKIAYCPMSVAFFYLSSLSKSSDEDNRNICQVWLGFEGIGQLKTIAARHRDIGEDKVWVFTLDQF